MDWLFNTHFINNGGAALHLLIWLYRRCETEKEKEKSLLKELCHKIVDLSGFLPES